MFKIRNMTEKQAPSYPLRMPPALREQLTQVAQANNRSVNAEILARLESTFTDAGNSELMLDTVREITERIILSMEPRIALGVQQAVARGMRDPAATKAARKAQQSLESSNSDNGTIKPIPKSSSQK